MNNNQNIINFIENYFSEEECFFITTINHTTNKTNNFHHNINTFKKYINSIQSKNTSDSIYFTLNAFKSYSNSILNNYNTPSKTKENVSHIKALIFDFDNPTTSKMNLTNLVKSLNIVPSYVLQTSENKFQVCFKLNNTNIDFKEYELINKTLAKYFDSDSNVCSIEKVFRFPHFFNKKNNYETNFKTKNFNNSYDFDLFKNYVLNNLDNEDMQKYYNENINIQQNIKTQKIEKIVSPVAAKIEVKEVDKKYISKYKIILKNNFDDASNCDILYIKERAKIEKDFDIIFNEILYIREQLNKPLKRNLTHYYQDRYNIFLEV
ncbi:DNA-primase RepB domain-containing protein [Aliarcobacter butzleri]